MIDKDTEARILRYHFVEQWGVNTIARQLGIHHSTVDRVLAQAGLPKAERARRPSIVDPYHPLIIETLAQYPTLSAARLLGMAQARGYTGGASQFRAHVAQLRPRRPAEAYLRLKTLPGEQGQVDWGHFGHVQIERAKRPLMAFVMVLSFSRQIFLRFYLNQRMDNFLRGHVAAFDAFQGVPRVLLYDNLRSAVLERRGTAIRFHPTLLDLSAHYRFEPRPVAPARGNEKGRVERAIRYIRENFFAGRTWSTLDDLNAQADAWCAGASAQRPCPEDPDQRVAEAFADEQAHLIALPDNPYPTDERVEVSAGKTPYVRFDLNDYSVPHTQVRRTLMVVASLTQVQGARWRDRHRDPSTDLRQGPADRRPGPCRRAGRGQTRGPRSPRPRSPGPGRAGQSGSPATGRRARLPPWRAQQPSSCNCSTTMAPASLNTRSARPWPMTCHIRTPCARSSSAAASSANNRHRYP